MHTGFTVLVLTSDLMGAPTHPTTSAAVNHMKRMIGRLKISERSEKNVIKECNKVGKKERRRKKEGQVCEREWPEVRDWRNQKRDRSMQNDFDGRSENFNLHWLHCAAPHPPILTQTEALGQ